MPKLKGKLLKPEGLPARILPTISGDWTDVDTMIFRLARTDESALELEYEAIRSALYRLTDLKYIRTRNWEGERQAQLTEEGEAYLNTYQEPPAPRGALRDAAVYIVHALHLKGVHVTGPVEAIAAGYMTRDDWGSVVQTFRRWMTTQERAA